MLLSFLTISQQGTKRVPHSIKGITYEGTTYARRFPGIALRDALHHALRAHPTCNGIRATRSTDALTMNTLHTQRFSSQRRPGEFSRSESPTRQGEAPVYPDASVSSRDHRAGIISAEMIVMVVQPHPAGGRVARRHCVPGDADLLPSDVSPFSGDTIIYSLVAYPMGAGRTRIAPGKQAGKDGGKIDVEKRCGYLTSAMLLLEILFRYFPVGNTEIDNAKNWRAMSSLASPGATPTTLHASGTLVFSFLFGSSLRCVPILSEGIAL